MLNREGIKKLCLSLGRNNKSTYSVIAISTANGIFRPAFTMLKKGENSENKKYAAIREGLTELIAIPSYLICGELAAKCGEKIAQKTAEKELQKMEKQGKHLTQKAKDIFRTTKIKDSKASLMLIGVCTAAGIVIPAICSAIMNPLMTQIKLKEKSKKQNTDNINDYLEENIYGPNFKSKQIVRPNIYNHTRGICSMKVGNL